MRIIMLLSIIFVMISAIFLFRIKHEVLDIERKILAAHKAIRQCSRDTMALQSELSYLTRPQRIHALGRQFFPHFQTLQPQQMTRPSHPAP